MKGSNLGAPAEPVNGADGLDLFGRKGGKRGPAFDI